MNGIQENIMLLVHTLEETNAKERRKVNIISL